MLIKVKDTDEDERSSVSAEDKNGTLHYHVQRAASGFFRACVISQLVQPGGGRFDLNVANPIGNLTPVSGLRMVRNELNMQSKFATFCTYQNLKQYGVHTRNINSLGLGMILCVILYTSEPEAILNFSGELQIL